MEQERLNKILKIVAERQEAGTMHICPRCGKQILKSPYTHNALSRRCDVYICSDCGMEEAFADFARLDDPVEEWAVIQFLDKGEK